MKNKYLFREYNPIYIDQFQQEKEKLFKFLGDKIIIEHIGSTSVPGLGGKGFIDIMIGVNAASELNLISKKLQKSGYNFEALASSEERLYFDREFINNSGQSNMYHIHLTYFDKKDWKELIGFRNYLIANPQAKNEYSEIKKQAVEKCKGKRELYVKIKNPFILKTIRKISCSNE